MKKERLQRYFVAGSQNFPDLTLAEYEERLALMMQSGITVYQFREKPLRYRLMKNELWRFDCGKRHVN